MKFYLYYYHNIYYQMYFRSQQGGSSSVPLPPPRRVVEGLWQVQLLQRSVQRKPGMHWGCSPLQPSIPIFFHLLFIFICLQLVSGRSWKIRLEKRRPWLSGSERAYHTKGLWFESQRGYNWGFCLLASAGMDPSVSLSLKSDASSFGWDVKPRSSPCSMHSIKHRL